MNMIMLALGLAKEGVSLAKLLADPKIRKQWLEISRAKYADRALFVGSDIIDVADRQYYLDMEMKRLRGLKKRDHKWLKKVIKVEKTKFSLWDRFRKFKRVYRRLLIKE